MAEKDQEGWADAVADVAGDEIEAQETNPGSEEAKSAIGSILVPMIFIGVIGVVLLLLVFQFF